MEIRSVDDVTNVRDEEAGFFFVLLLLQRGNTSSVSGVCYTGAADVVVLHEGDL